MEEPAAALGDSPVPTDVAAPVEHQIPWLTEDQVVWAARDEDLHDGWTAAIPSWRFFSIAIGATGAGLIIAGLGIRFLT